MSAEYKFLKKPNNKSQPNISRSQPTFAMANLVLLLVAFCGAASFAEEGVCEAPPVGSTFATDPPAPRSLPVLQTQEVLDGERGAGTWELIHGEGVKKMATELSDQAVQPHR